MPLAGCIRKVSTRSQPIIPDHRKDPVPDRTCKRYGLTDGEIPYPIVHSLEKEFPDCKLQQDGSFLFKGAAAGALLRLQPWAERRYWERPRRVRPLPAFMGLLRLELPWPVLAEDLLRPAVSASQAAWPLWGQPLPCRLLQPADTCGIKVFANNIRRCWLTKRP